jgi:hypothetical protein
MCNCNHSSMLIYKSNKKKPYFRDHHQTSRNLLRSCQSFGLTDMKILSDRKIFCRSEKKVTVTCIMFSLAFLEWFTLVLAIGHLILPLVFIEVKVIQFSVLFKIVYVMSFIVCLEFWWPCTIGQWLYEKRHVIG